MTTPVKPEFQAIALDTLATATGRIAILVDGDTPKTLAAKRLDRLTRGALKRFLKSEAYGRMKPGDAADLAFPSGLAADTLQVICLPRRADQAQARKAGGAVGKSLGKAGCLLIAESHPRAADVALGLTLRAYDFHDHKTGDHAETGAVTVMATAHHVVAAAYADHAALAAGVFFTRDLVNEPANILTTFEFAERLTGLRDLGVEVEVLEEEDLTHLGMNLLLAVGQGSESPSKVVVMQWKGGEPDAAPLALIGKGVVFDTGGISIKGAGGMEEMTMDMGGAGVVAGVMRAVASRKANANVTGIVGIVENMPDGRATRPGDVVRSMKGDTVEIINTDAEGRLVLADILWYAQDRFKPAGIIDLATLTGAIIVALGHENTGVFSNDDDLCNAFLKAAAAEGEGAWRMPMGQAYDDRLKSRIADMMNVGGREGGATIAAQFLKRFIKDGMPWIHLDIAGTALVKGDLPTSPKGATGWGVLALNRLIRDKFETR
ncbi:MAG: leucyl aminopeptidase [bacterium]